MNHSTNPYAAPSAVVDSAFGAGAIPFTAVIVPLAALLLILSQERRSRVGRALSPQMAESR